MKVTNGFDTGLEGWEKDPCRWNGLTIHTNTGVVEYWLGKDLGAAEVVGGDAAVRPEQTKRPCVCHGTGVGYAYIVGKEESTGSVVEVRSDPR